ncbi:extracellular solute-binding protein [Devosia rhodophyticola]|uniref:Extracellular solute-binding protein n=1 Tax=Devosia rhodophyticola TaxID=3026423 RepID=A0ABY7Z0N0_9HYPH|nr:extracellular solute-binding protein [Devosia rhodophyticola]WDR07208.1 extracellular solute-binding protein [Devosia rhodophyticola]
MTIRIDRRQFLVGSTTLMAAGAMGISPVLSQEARLRLLFWGGQARADRTYGVTDLYDKANPGQVVEGEFLGWGDYWPKLATQTAGGNAPDIIQMDYRYIVEYADRGAIAPLDDYVGDVLKLDDFDQDQLDGGKVNGKLYGISLGANSVAMMVNKAAFERAGVELPGKMTTYDDLKAMAEKFNAKGEMKLIGDGSGSEPMLENWLRQKGKALYTAEGKLAFDEADATEWFAMWADLRDAGVCVSAEDQALDTGPLETTMVTLGKAAMIPSNSNQLVAFQAINQDEITITNFPRIATDAPGGHYRKPSMFFSVAGKSNDKESSAKFISFFVNDKDAATVLGVERGIPCSASVRDALAPTLDDQSKIALNFVSNLGDLLAALPPSPPAAAGEIDSSLLRTISQEVGFGARSPEDAGPALVSGAAEILARAAS